MRRRHFITLVGYAAMWPRGAQAEQPAKVWRIGSVQVGPRDRPQNVAFEQRLRELGYVDGKNIAIEFLSVAGQLDRFGETMKELVRREVDIILAPGPEVAIRSALAATRTLPIVTIAIDYDIVANGYAKNLAQPGGNVTGIGSPQIELTTKRLQLIKDTFPNLRGLSVFWDQLSADQWQVVRTAAAHLGIAVFGIELRGQTYDYERGLEHAPAVYRSAFYELSSPAMFPDRFRLAEVALRQHAASMFVFREYVEAGGLMAYGPNLPGMFRSAAEYVDRIIKGAKPDALPIEQPTKFDFIINLKTAKALGVNLPSGILAITDEVIE